MAPRDGLREGDQAGISAAPQQRGFFEAARSQTKMRYAMVAVHFSKREKEPRCAVLRFAAALRLRLRVQARAAPG